MNPFSGSDVKEFQRGGTYFTSDPRCRQGATAADAALATSVEERLRLVVDIESTDDDEEEEEPSMEVDEFNGPYSILRRQIINRTEQNFVHTEDVFAYVY